MQDPFLPTLQVRGHPKTTLTRGGRYSCLPNTRRGWNNGIGWKIPQKIINVGDEINVLGGKFFPC